MKIKFALGQAQIRPGNPEANAKTALAFIQKAKEQHVDILLLPEMMVPGYLLGDLWEQKAYLKDCEAYGKEIIEATDGITVIFGNVGLDRDKVNEDGRMRRYNAAFIAQDRKLLKGGLPYPFICKTSLPDYREFDDDRYFHSLAKLVPELEDENGISDLIRPVTVNVRGKAIRLGVFICEDGWTENYFFNVPQILRQNGAQVLCNISCSPFTLQKNRKRNEVFSAQAKECGLPLLYCNCIGIQNNGKNIFTFDGCSCIHDKDGTLLADAPTFEEAFLTAYYDTETGTVTTDATTHGLASEVEEIYKSLNYGAREFLKQLGIKKMTIGLSGGIDSAVTAAFYVHILGPENVLLLNIPSRYNSDLTKSLACSMAKALGTNYAVLPIQDFVDHTVEQFNTTPIHNYTTGKDEYVKVKPAALENIQARDRGARIIAGLSSVWGGAFSCNSNKSETTVGYATFYGDIAGVFALIGDLWKHQVYALGRYLNEHVYKREVIPDAIFKIKPSAELSAAQTVGTGGDPIIYPYHDYLFRAFIESWFKNAPEEYLTWYLDHTLEEHIGCEKGIVDKLFPTAEAFIKDLERWWNLFSGLSVAKRIQAPPIIAISKRAYGYDHRESQLGPYYSRRYKELKAKVLGESR
ncbi:MAG: NAD(+) synthase [Acidaminococcus sp.]|nr:NAD(+) synthase [Acidaminococcus sp.]MCI2100967.1 NAD(+) synthase [Acidaminococcus sp.]MCI2115310.1 NAD(+) synthase [Acidaminococcus sp.]MCI2117365.1 NAD(+) synthase [Acidaminococcus sp.]